MAKPKSKPAAPKPTGQYKVGYGKPPSTRGFGPATAVTQPAAKRVNRPPMKSS
jgi:hypothetical protein